MTKKTPESFSPSHSFSGPNRENSSPDNQSISIIEQAFNQSVYAINITDLEGKLLNVNEAYLKLYKFDHCEEVLNKTQRIIASPKTPNVVYEDMWNTIGTDKIWSGELTNLARDGREVFVHLTITPIFQKQIKIGYMGFSLDRSQQVALEKQLLHANKLVVLGTLGAGLAHELNNPLTSISLEAEYIKETLPFFSKTKNLAALQHATDSIIKATERMERVIKHLLVYSRKDSGMERELLYFHQLVDDSFLFMGKQLENRGIEITLSIPKNLPLYGSKTDLESVIHNLLTNSRDAFQEKPNADPQIRISASKSDKGFLLIEFWDNAGGITRTHLDKVFDPFFTTKGEGEGTGLGLSITKKILVEHGGGISVTSENGETLFKIRIPLAGFGGHRDQAE